MRVLVVGASGFIGAAVMAALAPDHQVQGTFRSNRSRWVDNLRLQRLDALDLAAVRALCRRLRPDAVVAAAGSKDIAACAATPETARTAHALQAVNLADACAESGARLVYVSTDCVFPGDRPRFAEDAETAPCNGYGTAKLAAERLIAGSGVEAAIVRVSLVFGWTLPGQPGNFVQSVYDTLVGGRRFAAATNLHNTPLHVDPVARAVAEIVSAGGTGVFHVAGRDRLSRFDLARAAARTFGLNASLLDPAVDRSGLRPTNSCLATTRTADWLGTPFEGVAEGLARMRQRLPRAGEVAP